MFILASFWDAQTIKNRSNIVCETDAFFNTVFVCVFFRILAILARFGEAPGDPKIAKNRQTIHSGPVWSALVLSVRFRM